MNIAVEQARRRGGKAIRANLVQTPKNGVISDLFSRLGFSPVRDEVVGSGCTSWFLDLDKHVSYPTHIRRS
jgi:predicted enzyme involved in methoxymalonyl-ACP biosynthesis